MKRVELEHHFGWEPYQSKNATALEDAAIEGVRKSHEFLTNENHVIAVTNGTVNVYRTQDATPPSITPPWALRSFKAGALWFSVPFRAPAKL